MSPDSNKMNGNSIIQEIDLRNVSETVSVSTRVRTKKRKRIIERGVIARLPARSSSEIPILLLLSSSPDGKMSTKSVLYELRNGKWFSELKDGGQGSSLRKIEKKRTRHRTEIFEKIVGHEKTSVPGRRGLRGRRMEDHRVWY